MGVTSQIGNRQSALPNPAPAEILNSLDERRIPVPRRLTRRFCPADFVAGMGSASSKKVGDARADMTHSTVTPGYYIEAYYESQAKSTSVRGYNLSLPESRCCQRSADLFCRSAAIPLRSAILPPVGNEEPRTYKNRSALRRLLQGWVQ